MVSTPRCGFASQQRHETGPWQPEFDSPSGHAVFFGFGGCLVGGGCFWCLEAVFDLVKGVRGTQSGYTGGHTLDPTYKQVCTGTTGHAEVVQVEFDPDVIGYADLLEIFFGIHDPTTLNRQGGDMGTQYRSAIFTHSDKQDEIARDVIAELGVKGPWLDPIVTVIAPLEVFHAAVDETERDHRLELLRDHRGR